MVHTLELPSHHSWTISVTCALAMWCSFSPSGEAPTQTWVSWGVQESCEQMPQSKPLRVSRWEWTTKSGPPEGKHPLAQNAVRLSTSCQQTVKRNNIFCPNTFSRVNKQNYWLFTGHGIRMLPLWWLHGMCTSARVQSKTAIMPQRHAALYTKARYIFKTFISWAQGLYWLGS